MGPNRKRPAAGINHADIKTIEKFAGRELNYEGADIGMDYDFGGAVGGFASEGAADQSFSFVIDNTGANAVDRVIAIGAGFFTAEADLQAAGYPAVGILRDGQVVPGAAAGAEVTAASKVAQRSISAMLEFMKFNPARVVAIHMQADDPEQFDTNLELATYSPFRNLGQDYIRLQDFYDPDQFSSKKIEIPLISTGQTFQLDNQQIALMTILAGRRVTMTLFFGAINNQAKKLASRARQFHARQHQQLAAIRSAAK
jgi:hypothetical protein